MPAIYLGPEAGRAAWNAAQATNAATDENRAEVMYRLRQALVINAEDLTAMQTALGVATNIAYGPDITSLAQGAAAIKKLAQGIELLLNTETRTKWEVNGLIRLAINRLDTITDSGESF